MVLHHLWPCRSPRCPTKKSKECEITAPRRVWAVDAALKSLQRGNGCMRASFHSPCRPVAWGRRDARGSMVARFVGSVCATMALHTHCYVATRLLSGSRTARVNLLWRYDVIVHAEQIARGVCARFHRPLCVRGGALSNASIMFCFQVAKRAMWPRTTLFIQCMFAALL